MADLAIHPFTEPFDATITPPGSKSLTNRALVLAALSNGSCRLSNVLFADDTQVMLDGLGKLGFRVEVDQPTCTVTVQGEGGTIPADNAELFCGNSGTTIRFLAALCALGQGTYILDGIARMRQRPIGPLVEMLRGLGVRAESLLEPGFPPIRVQAHGLPGGLLKFATAPSSQYLSAVLMAGPYARHEVRIDLEGKQTSWPYVAMTMQLMDQFHITCELVRDPATDEPRRIIVPKGVYRAIDYAIEPDASNASYFLAAAAIRKGARVTIEHLGRASLQGDVGFADVLHRMGADLVFGRDFITIIGTGELHGIDVDLSGMPDTAQTLAVAALFADGPSTLRGLHTLRVKETDRLAALQNELAKLGAQVQIEADNLHIIPPTVIRSAAIETYDDHRMAMSFAVAGTVCPGIAIRDPDCVNKTYPVFFGDLRRLGEQVRKDKK